MPGNWEKLGKILNFMAAPSHTAAIMVNCCRILSPGRGPRESECDHQALEEDPVPEFVRDAAADAAAHGPGQRQPASLQPGGSEQGLTPSTAGSARQRVWRPTRRGRARWRRRNPAGIESGDAPAVWNTAWRGTKRTKRFPRKTRAKANVGKADRASWQVTDQGRAKRSLGKRSVPRRDAADGGRSLPLAAQEARLPYTNTDRKSRMVRNRGLTKKRPSPPPPTFLGRK